MLTARLARRTASSLLGCLILAAGCATTDPEILAMAQLNEERLEDLDDRLVAHQNRIDALMARVAELTAASRDLRTAIGDVAMDIDNIRKHTPALDRFETSQERQAKLTALMQRFSLVDDAAWIDLKESLIRLGAPAVGPLLQRYAAGEPLALRRVPQVLRALIDPLAVTELAAGLENHRSRALAAEALGLLGNAEGIPFLRAHLEDERADIRHAIAVALGQLGDLRGLKVLIGELNSPELDVRMIAGKEIEQITGQDFGYSAYEKDEAKRAEMIKRVEEWLDAQGDASPPADGGDAGNPGTAGGAKPGDGAAAPPGKRKGAER